jgi:hypothetical protein
MLSENKSSAPTSVSGGTSAYYVYDADGDAQDGRDPNRQQMSAMVLLLLLLLLFSATHHM